MQLSTHFALRAACAIVLYVGEAKIKLALLLGVTTLYLHESSYCKNRKLSGNSYS